MDAVIGRHEQDDDRSSPESQPESPTQYGLSSRITKATSYPISSHRKSSKALQKRVISVPVDDREVTRFKGDGAPPPSDSWAWRKYGQKPIKGSPYPRGYYRCSSSKGCPARKQVERSRDDPTILVVTYCCEHNHPWPAPKNNHRSHNNHNFTTATTTNHEEEKPGKRNWHVSPDPEPEEKTTDFSPEGSGLGSRGLDVADEFGWFMDMRTTPSTILESPTFGEDYYHHHRSDINKYERKTSIGDTDLTMFFPMREEDESLFSDLGELPECAAVFSPGKTYNNNGVAQIC